MDHRVGGRQPASTRLLQHWREPSHVSLELRADGGQLPGRHRITVASDTVADFAHEDGGVWDAEVVDRADGLGDAVVRADPKTVVERREAGEAKPAPQQVSKASIVLGHGERNATPSAVPFHGRRAEREDLPAPLL